MWSRELTIVLADAELELTPGAPDVGASLEGSFHAVPVLDAFFHQKLVQGLPSPGRRGRPDIVHMSLSLCQGSALNRQGLLRSFVHTREDRVIAIDPCAHVPPNYVEFLELMAKLLRGQRVDGYALEEKDLAELVRGLHADLVVTLDPDGEEGDIQAVVRARSPASVMAIVGAFPSGDFISPVRELADVHLSLGPELLTVPTVVSEVLSSLHR
jgi:rRNA small subunit pseudouridine methyltransferase Nep1